MVTLTISSSGPSYSCQSRSALSCARAMAPLLALSASGALTGTSTVSQVVTWRLMVTMNPLPDSATTSSCFSIGCLLSSLGRLSAATSPIRPERVGVCQSGGLYSMVGLSFCTQGGAMPVEPLDKWAPSGGAGGLPFQYSQPSPRSDMLGIETSAGTSRT